MDQQLMKFELFVDQRNFDDEETRLRHKVSWYQDELAKATGGRGTDWDATDSKRQRAAAKECRRRIKEAKKCLSSL